MLRDSSFAMELLAIADFRLSKIEPGAHPLALIPWFVLALLRTEKPIRRTPVAISIKTASLLEDQFFGYWHSGSHR
ncbi:hypothetical protein GCM10011586_21910 [Silvibacterium dinghuense]|nr:hypothetical protein GCM10011586_21910 [Silvibacterium dinghuense]